MNVCVSVTVVRFPLGVGLLVSTGIYSIGRTFI